jgi:hypothetical protein
MVDFFASLPSALILLPILLALFLTGAGLTSAAYGLRKMRAGQHDGPPGYVWQSLLFVAILDVILFAGMDVGKFREFFADSWGGIVGVAATLFAPWLGYKAVKVAGTKGGSVESGGQ